MGISTKEGCYGLLLLAIQVLIGRFSGLIRARIAGNSRAINSAFKR